ncbi:hypothetical protein [uncultured Celeribacter sp.]|uniref:hypothetical protein n=1 Tax=uncultured Celeribacter sp. TaxID=1303376 RepID=UPI002AA6D07F|nr:hypothetical protein [uncultured Celeribacter sp.]
MPRRFALGFGAFAQILPGLRAWWMPLLRVFAVQGAWDRDRLGQASPPHLSFETGKNRITSDKTPKTKH